MYRQFFNEKTLADANRFSSDIILNSHYENMVNSENIATNRKWHPEERANARKKHSESHDAFLDRLSHLLKEEKEGKIHVTSLGILVSALQWFEMKEQNRLMSEQNQIMRDQNASQHSEGM